MRLTIMDIFAVNSCNNNNNNKNTCEFNTSHLLKQSELIITFIQYK